MFYNLFSEWRVEFKWFVHSTKSTGGISWSSTWSWVHIKSCQTLYTLLQSIFCHNCFPYIIIAGLLGFVFHLGVINFQIIIFFFFGTNCNILLSLLIFLPVAVILFFPVILLETIDRSLVKPLDHQREQSTLTLVSIRIWFSDLLLYT